MFSERLTVLKRSRLALVGGGVAMALAFFLFGMASREPALGAMGAGALQVAALIFAARWRWNVLPRKSDALIEADARGVRVNGAEVVRRDKLKSGYFQPQSGSRPPSVKLVDALGGIRFEAAVANEEQGIALLRALELDATSRAIEFSGASPLATSTVRQIVLWIPLMMLLWTLGVMTYSAYAPFMVLLPIIAMLYPSKIRVGADGVLVRWLGWKRLTPFARVKRIGVEDRAIVLEQTNGELVRLVTSPARRNSLRNDTRHRDAVHARIREAFAEFHTRATRAEVRAMVAPAGRTAAEWVKQLRALASHAGDYRSAAVPEDELWRVIEDPASDASARAGAATVLAKSLDDEGRARIRIAADTSASPKLRVALERVVDGAEDEALDAALAEIADAESKARAG